MLLSCYICKLVKSCLNFYVDRSRKRGYKYECKSCSATLLKKYQTSENGRDNVNRLARVWRSKNPNKIKELNQQYYLENSKELIQKQLIWMKNNPAKVNAVQMKRNCAKKNRTPKWLTNKQIDEIRQFYIKASEMTKKENIKYEVDHIIPLQGKNVCGLHVPWNLQILTKQQNLKKGNRMELTNVF